MKIRSDFVSNSSSTSFVVAVNQSYDIYSFSKDMAKNSINVKFKYHNPGLKKLNEVNLTFSLLHYELLFLGSYMVDKEETIIRKSELPKTLNSVYTFGIAEWNYELNLLEKWKKIKDDPSAPDYGWLSENDESWYDENTQTLHLVRKDFVSGIAVDLDKYYYLRNDFTVRKRIENGTADIQQVNFFNDQMKNKLKEIAELCSKYNGDYRSINTSNSYAITLNTIQNTKDMISGGFDMKFEEWEDINKLENMLRNGEKLFMIRQNNSGDGYLKDGIFAEDDSPLETGNHNVPMEVLYSEGG